jgi:hypothetical protein
MIEFLILHVILGLNPLYAGLIMGFALILPSAIITRAYGPIIVIGVAGGLLIGGVNQVVLG